MSDHQEQQMIGILTSINENVGGIREEMAGIKSDVRKQGDDITEIKSDMKNENLPTRLSLVERDTARIIRGLWVVGTALAGLIVHRLWTIITGKESP